MKTKYLIIIFFPAFLQAQSTTEQLGHGGSSAFISQSEWAKEAQAVWFGSPTGVPTTNATKVRWTGTEFVIDGKLTVTGLIDPTGMEFTPQTANPSNAFTIWGNSTDGRAYWGSNQIAFLSDITTSAETDPVFSASEAFSITGQNKIDWFTAFNWGDHANEGYLKNGTETVFDNWDKNALDDLKLGTTATTALAGNTTTITSAQAAEIVANTAKTNTTNTSVSVTGTGTKTLSIFDSDGNDVATSFTDENDIPNNATISILAGTGITGGGTFTANQSANSSITINSSVVDTKLTEAEVDGFVANNGYLTTETDDQTASEVPFTATGNTTSTNMQAAIVELQTEINNNTAKNSYPAADSTKLSGIEAGAEVNVQSDWNETNTSSDSYILNKPTITGGTDDQTAAEVSLNPAPIADISSIDVQAGMTELAAIVSTNTAKVTNATHTGDVTGATDLTITTGAVAADELASTAVTAGTYGSATQVPQYTVDEDGRITAASNITISATGDNLGNHTATTNFNFGGFDASNLNGLLFNPVSTNGFTLSSWLNDDFRFTSGGGFTTLIAGDGNITETNHLATKAYVDASSGGSSIYSANGTADGRTVTVGTGDLTFLGSSATGSRTSFDNMYLRGLTVGEAFFQNSGTVSTPTGTTTGLDFVGYRGSTSALMNDGTTIVQGEIALYLNPPNQSSAATGTVLTKQADGSVLWAAGGGSADGNGIYTGGGTVPNNTWAFSNNTMILGGSNNQISFGSGNQITETTTTKDANYTNYSLSVGGSTGTSGQVLTANGAGNATWVTPSGGGTDDQQVIGFSVTNTGILSMTLEGDATGAKNVDLGNVDISEFNNDAGYGTSLNYSTSEQDTGIDDQSGNSIFQRTFSIGNLASGATSNQLLLGSYELLSSELCFLRGTTKWCGNGSVSTSFTDALQKVHVYQTTSTSASLSITNNSGFGITNAVITVRYTK